METHFARSQPPMRQAYEAALHVVRALGPVDVLAEKSRIAWHLRMSFAAFQPRVSWLDGTWCWRERWNLRGGAASRCSRRGTCCTRSG